MKTKPVSELKPGDLVDLQGDKYADPNNDHPELEFELQVVDAVERETDTCIAIWFDDFDCVGFPPDHVVQVLEGEIAAMQNPIYED